MVVMIVGALAFLEGVPMAATTRAAAHVAVAPVATSLAPPRGTAVPALRPRFEVVIRASAFLRLVRIATCEMGWGDCWARVAAEADATPDRLYILWEESNGCVRVQTYAVDRAFILEHQEADWIRAFAVVPNGSQLLGITHTEVTVLIQMPLPGEPSTGWHRGGRSACIHGQSA
jgi:hypothetical protein